MGICISKDLHNKISRIERDQKETNDKLEIISETLLYIKNEIDVWYGNNTEDEANIADFSKVVDKELASFDPDM